MKIISWNQFLSLSAVALAAFLIGGCSQTGGDTDASAVSQEAGHEHGEDGHNHGGWWCTEHGIPEGICAQCSSKLAAEYQQKGDWCEEHNRPDSQCFIHHPELEAKFIAQYEAKFGEKPPQRELE